MQLFNLAFATSVALTICIVDAAPADNQLAIYHVEKEGEQDLTYYSFPSSSVAARSAVPRACGTDDVICAADNGATPAICNELILILNRTPTALLNGTPAAIGLGQASNQCCISWNANAGAMQQGALVHTATKVYNTCLAPSTLRQSGVALNIILNGFCVTQCLSNRPDGCL
ncbi:hypothetical protein B0H19DRAFT_921467 [Mycena capillaripes]|nr:hypothetical protein B0H19DRAFT_921467 [Mycena capillaripes]